MIKTVIKRDGRIVFYNKDKIINAIMKAFMEVDKECTPEALNIANNIINTIEISTGEERLSVEEIQDAIEKLLMKSSREDVARAYVRFRYKRELARKTELDKIILGIVNCKNEYWKQENSNKNPRLNTTIRDYIAGAVSTNISRKILLPKDVIEAHDEGLIHYHDMDYAIQKMHNCCLVNLENMLMNGTVISETRIDKPHSFSTACTITTQIIAQVASSQYGGQSISLAHLAPFVDISRKAFIEKVKKEHDAIGKPISDEQVKKIAEMRTREEITKGIQTIQYQITTLMTTNGQAPFITLFMYLNEAKNEQEKKDLSILIEEVLKQSLQGVKNEEGVWITPAFPKLIYVLQEDNNKEGSKYWYLTKLAAECSLKRLTPDYISEKVMKEMKEGYCFPVMGCVDGKEIITYKLDNKLYVESFERMWQRLSDKFEIKHQYSSKNPNLYMDLKNVLIYDTENGFVNTEKIIRNISSEWLDIKFSNGRRLLCTKDHPLTLLNGDTLKASQLKTGDSLLINSNQYNEENIIFNEDKAWLLGFMLCDGCYQSGLFASVAAKEEDDIADKFIDVMEKYFDLNVEKKLQQRGQKGVYYDLIAHSTNGHLANYNNYFAKKFEGLNKIDRHIPNEVFSWNYASKLSFMAGMIDADGYINSHNNCIVQIGSTNKELALQQMALAQSLGMPAKIYHNHYSKKNPEAIRYRIEFCPNDELINYIVCKKKRNNYIESSVSSYNTSSEVININFINKEMYSYDVTTSSEHFEVSGIYSHNCRSALSTWYDENGNAKFYGRFNKGRL